MLIVEQRDFLLLNLLTTIHFVSIYLIIMSTLEQKRLFKQRVFIIFVT